MTSWEQKSAWGQLEEKSESSSDLTVDIEERVNLIKSTVNELFGHTEKLPEYDGASTGPRNASRRFIQEQFDNLEAQSHIIVEKLDNLARKATGDPLKSQPDMQTEGRLCYLETFCHGLNGRLVENVKHMKAIEKKMHSLLERVNELEFEARANDGSYRSPSELEDAGFGDGNDDAMDDPLEFDWEIDADNERGVMESREDSPLLERPDDEQDASTTTQTAKDDCATNLKSSWW